MSAAPAPHESASPGEFSGLRALVTGGASGIGAATARALQGRGARVAVLDLHPEAAPEGTLALRCDVSDAAEVRQAVDSAAEQLGGLDVVINNAGIGEQKMIDETDDDWMLYVINTNLGGPMRYIREALKIFLPKNDGVIINISSVNGTRPFCGATYTSTKGALNTLTKNVAMRLIDTNIRCNAVAPGATVTPAHLANKAGEQPGGAEMLKYSGHFVYFPGPEGDPMDQAYTCLYLASKMGRAVRGQVIQVCNGAFL